MEETKIGMEGRMKEKGRGGVDWKGGDKGGSKASTFPPFQK